MSFPAPEDRKNVFLFYQFSKEYFHELPVVPGVIDKLTGVSVNIGHHLVMHQRRNNILTNRILMAPGIIFSFSRNPHHLSFMSLGG